MSFAIPKQQCPYCGYVCDRCSHAFGDAKPKPGDVSLCFRCMEISFFDGDMNLRRPLPIELENLRNSPEWEQIEQVRADKRKVMAKRN